MPQGDYRVVASEDGRYYTKVYGDAEVPIDDEKIDLGTYPPDSGVDPVDPAALGVDEADQDGSEPDDEGDAGSSDDD